jgi:asparagine synthase (glutamine-hydrolysing)
MCGIAGIFSFDGRPVDAEVLRRMCAVMVHRGPDDEGFYVRSDVGLGMRRLSIIDLSTGHQPVGNEDGSVWVVLNGEIYNFADLRAELERRGHAFSTATDTEVIVHLYEEYGTRCVNKLRGMFAFAVWDARRRQLLVARDRLGIKPLYYAHVDGRLFFASEVKALLQVPEIDTRLSWSAVNHLFTFLSTPRAESIVADVRKLEPGHILVATARDGLRTERYWNVRFEPDYRRSEDSFVEGLRELLEESVRLHLVSDVPLGAFLSGGVDSSAVVATMARLTGRPVKTFSIGFREPDFTELEYARLVARQFGTEHHELTIEPDVVDVIEDLAWHLDEPFGDPSALPTFMVSKLAADHVTVVVSGDGGDELFAGYDKYVVEARERRYRLPAAARRALGALAGLIPDGVTGRNFLGHLALTGPDRYLNASTLFRQDQKRKLFRPETFDLIAAHDPWREAARDLATASGGWLAALQYLDLHSYLPLDILTKVDRMSMAHSLEARVPLLDHKLVEFAATVPAELQLRHGTTKYLFKRAMRGILPDTILDRPKRGFGVPLARWFRGQLAGFVRDLLLSETSRRRGIFNTAYIGQLLDRNERGRELDLPLWTLVSFELWCRTFLDQRPAPAAPEAGRPWRPETAGMFATRYR